MRETAQPSWDDRYGEAQQIWSGKVNAVLADVGSRLTPGTALDLGSGEGADVIWLAEHGWHVTGVDISSVAVSMGRPSGTLYEHPSRAGTLYRGRFSPVE